MPNNTLFDTQIRILRKIPLGGFGVLRRGVSSMPVGGFIIRRQFFYNAVNTFLRCDATPRRFQMNFHLLFPPSCPQPTLISTAVQCHHLTEAAVHHHYLAITDHAKQAHEQFFSSLFWGDISKVLGFLFVHWICLLCSINCITPLLSRSFPIPSNFIWIWISTPHIWPQGKYRTPWGGGIIVPHLTAGGTVRLLDIFFIWNHEYELCDKIGCYPVWIALSCLNPAAIPTTRPTK